MNKITIITISYNAESVIEETIKSVINQTYYNIEYIIIDGGSKDDTTNIIKRYDKLLAYWVSEPDQGIYHAMNKGIIQATGDWILFLNSGDTFANNDVITETFYTHIPNEILVLYGSFKKKNGSFISEEIRPLPLKNLIFEMPFCHQSCFIRTETIKNEMFSLKYKIASDYYLFRNLYLKHGEKIFKKIDKTIAYFDITDSISQKQIKNLRKEYFLIRGFKGIVYWSINNLKKIIFKYHDIKKYYYY